MQARETADPLIADIFLAEQINQRNRGALVKPWALDEMPEEYLSAYYALITAGVEVEREEAQKTRMERYHREFRESHPTYRKY